MSTKRPTIEDVAALSGVGRSTVSRVLNGSPSVTEAARERVRRAVAMLDYKVNLQARSLASGVSRQLVLVAASDLESEPNSYYHSGLELGALRACAEAGYSLGVHSFNPARADSVRQIVGLIDGGRCDGLLLPPPFADDPALVDAILARGCPLVAIGGGPETRARTAVVGVDDCAAGTALAHHLLALGHRRFGYIRGPAGHVSAEGRFEGFVGALRAAGLDPAEARVARGDFTFRTGIEAAAALFAEPHDRPTALICANDDMAAGALLALHKLGIDIPGQVSVAGFDDTPVSEIVWPPLTTVHQPVKTIAQRAVEQLVAAIGLGRERLEPGFEVVPYRLVLRESTAGPMPA
ncbi:MAG: LacI family DNA-binding transcriptional regulator [Proteobacteria bacterium]|nr:LacI family DNA-binding transcriptional regulator [Pseudomonadota bacterium]